jgi:excisionase family DNA binding protein
MFPKKRNDSSGSRLRPKEKRKAMNDKEACKFMTKTEIQAMYEVMFTDYPDIVNVAQVQSMLGISRHLAYSLIGDGYIPGMKIGNAYRIPKINVIRYALSAGDIDPAA